jgi:hypothetical protein
MREEMKNTIQGFYPEIAKKQQFALRKMRTDSSGALIKCACVDVLTGEPDKDEFCPVCFGELYVWDEELVDGYRRVIRSSVGLSTKESLIGPGLTNLAFVSFFFEYTLPLNIFPKDISPDKIVELMTDTAGKPKRPFQRKTIYRIGTAIDFRADNGKLEYWKLDCYEEQVKFLNGPGG